MKIFKTYAVVILIYVFSTFQSQTIILPYGTQVGDSILDNGDDEVSEVLRLKEPLFFYDAQYYDLYISTNGIIFMQPPPRENVYVDRAFPLGFPAIAPFLADLDTSEGRGSVYYRIEESVDTLNHMAWLIQRSFHAFAFIPSHTVITTWEKVGCHLESVVSPESPEKVNTFQAVLVSDHQDTYGLLLYPEDGLQFFGTMPKTSDSPGVELPARVGFSGWQSSTSEERTYTLPVQSARNLTQQGNAGVPGLWMFHIGSRSSFQKIVCPTTSNAFLPITAPWVGREQREPAAGIAAPDLVDQVDFYILADSNADLTQPPPTVLSKTPSPTPLQVPQTLTQSSSPSTRPPIPQSLLPPERPSIPHSPSGLCGHILHLCSVDGYCTDHPGGPCCHCRSGYYGNGRHCLPQGVPQRLNGKLRGQLTLGGKDVLLEGVDLHGYAVVGEGRAHMSISPIPEKAGWALMTISPLIGLFGWLFALELQNFRNGFSLTGAEFTHHAVMTFYPSKQNLTVTHKAQGLNSLQSLWVETTINGELPLIPPDATVQLEPHKDIYHFNQSVVTSSSLRDVLVVSENGGLEKLSFLLHQNVTFQGCPHWRSTWSDVQQLSVEFVMVMYNKEGKNLKYSISNTIGPVGGLPDPGWVNPCSAGLHYCDPMALCMPGTGADYYCQCAAGYRGDGRSCFDVDECSEGLHACGLHAQCVNVAGSHHCVCDAGFEFDPDWRTCVDINECYTKQCHPFASCSNSEGSFHCQCWPGYLGNGLVCAQSVTAEPARRPLSLCEQHRASLQDGEGLGGWEGGPLEAEFVPQCDRDGQYLPLQCHGMTGHCWCVDSRGQERAGTRTNPGTTPVNCVKPVLYGVAAPSPPISSHPPLAKVVQSMCERWRRSLEDQYGGQASPQDYVPKCDYQGHFLPVQCYGDSTFCWCVDRDGREVLGTRSHSAVKPACLPTVTSLTPQPLVRSGVTSPPPKPAVLFSQGQQIFALPLDGHHMVKEKAFVLLTLKDSIVVGMDYDCLENQLYWSDLASRAIRRVPLESGAEPETVIHSGLSSPEGVSVCVNTRRLFWVDSGTDRIESARVDGEDREVLVDSDLVNPRAIVVDSASGTLYWTDWNRDGPRIESCTVTGQDRRLLVQEGIDLPNGLTLDPGSGQVCWVDAGSMKVECIDPDGTGRREVHGGLIGYPFSLALHEHTLYYTDWERDGVLMIDLEEGNQTEQYLPLHRSHPYGITVVCSSG